MSKKESPNWEELFLVYQKNVFPAMVEQLADDLGVTADSINKLGIGFHPGKQAWIIAERDHAGQIVGLQERYIDGKKFMVAGSKRGLVYECTGQFSKEENNSQRNRFERCYNVGVDCPLCGKRKWCMVSNDNPSDPAAVICGHTSEGSIRYIENSGYLHIRHGEHEKISRSPLHSSDKPYLVVEGATDVWAAKDIGYIAIGKPAAESGHTLLSQLLKGKEVIVVGENDEGTGKRGMQKSFNVLRAVCRSVQRVLPPIKYKDLRSWHPTSAVFENWVKEQSEVVENDNIVDSVDFIELADKWLKAQPHRLAYWLGDWYRHTGIHYQTVHVEWLRQQIRKFFKSFEVNRFNGKTQVIESLPINKKFVDEIQDAVKSACYIQTPKYITEPFYIGDKINLDLSRSVVFQNGIFHVMQNKLEGLSSEVFITSTLPYKYDPKATCPVWLWFVNDVFNEDQQCVQLLQEWFGYNLIASNHLQQMLYLYGVPGSGKSTTLDALQVMLGPDRCAAANVNSFTTAFGLQPLIGKYAAIISESGTTSRRQSQQALEKIKQITGQDTVNVNQKYKDIIDVKLFCRITYAANDLPSFNDEPQALFRRFNLLYYGNTYSNPDRTLGIKIAKEAPGIANWALQGLRRLLCRNDFTQPNVSQEYLDICRALASPIRTMIDMWCEFDVKSETPVGYLYDLHKVVSEENGDRPLNRIQFGRKLADAFPGKFRKVQKRIKGERVYVYEGLKIVPEAYKNFLGRP